MKKLTGFASAVVAEGQAINYTYSVIEDGRIVERNVRGTTIVDESNPEVMAAIQTINAFLTELIQ